MDVVRHTPVLADAVTSLLVAKAPGFYVDATVGTGGHAEHLMEAGGEGLRVLGIDRDGSSLEAAGERLSRFHGRISFACGNFRNIYRILEGQKCDGFLLDLGLSSFQLADTSRGFSYLRDGPLDMAMGKDGLSVLELLSSAREREIAALLRKYGEERRARAIAGEIVHTRDADGMTRTAQLRAAVERCVPARDAVASLSRVFQALRIWANDELESLREFLPKALDMLNTGGRIVVISYHSLEDRIVKNFFKLESRGCKCPPDFPECRCGGLVRLKVLTRRPLRPSREEIESNSRARSAKLRAAERI